MRNGPAELRLTRKSAPYRVTAAVEPGPGEALVDRADEASGFTITIKPSGRTLRIVG